MLAIRITCQAMPYAPLPGIRPKRCLCAKNVLPWQSAPLPVPYSGAARSSTLITYDTQRIKRGIMGGGRIGKRQPSNRERSSKKARPRRWSRPLTRKDYRYRPLSAPGYRPSATSLAAVASSTVTPAALSSAIFSANCGRYFSWATSSSLSTCWVLEPFSTMGLR